MHVDCCSGDCGTVSPLHASEVGCANLGSTVRLCSALSCMVQGLNFSYRQSMDCKLLHDSQQLVRCLRVGKSMVRAAQRIDRRRVKWPRRRPRHSRMRVRRCFFRWRMFLSRRICWLAKLSCGSVRLVGWTPKQQCEDSLPDLWGAGQSEAELNKRLLPGLGELLRSVTSTRSAGAVAATPERQETFLTRQA